MEPNYQNRDSSKTPKKNISFGLIVSWIFSFLFVYVGLTLISTSVLIFLIYIIMALVIFPPCNQFIEKKFNVSFSILAKIFLILIGFLFIGLVINQKIEADQNLIEVNIKDINQIYRDNEIKANEMYKDKLLKISGNVLMVKKKSIIIKDPENYFSKINCLLDNKTQIEKASKLVRNQPITIQGRNTYKRSKMITLKKCNIIN